MTQLELDIRKTIDQNAADYFEKSKKYKKKLEGALKALEQSKQKLKILMTERYNELEKEKQKQITIIKRPEKKWFEKFHWFYTSDRRLAIGGRDATTNEIIIKKYTEKDDLVFHTDMAGSPFFILKTEEKKVPENILKEVADAVCSYSKAWKLGLSTQQVFYVKPEQVSKTAQSGEYLTKGAFVIRGKTTYIPNEINLAVGITKDNIIMGGPLEAIKANCVKYVKIIQGDEKTGSIAKKIQHRLGATDLDEIIRMLPAGGCKIKE